MGGLFKTALAGWWNDRAMSLGASIAFFTVFSLAPMLLVAIAVAGLAFSREAAQGAIVEELGGLVGGQTGAALEAMIASAGHFDSGVVGLVLGVATFLFLATGAIIELQDDLNIVWKVTPPETYGIGAFVRTRLLSLALIVGFGFLLMVSLVLDAGLTRVGAYLEASFSGASVILRTLNSLVALAIAVLLFAMILKILPAVDLTWRDVWMGAVVTALLFTAGKFAIGYYIGKSGLASAYGAAASIVTILLWIYYSSLILLNAPGMSVIGAGEPALPGISIGHNGQIAFGLTIFSIDQEDLYVYELNPANPDEYRYGSGWEPMRIVRERLEVKGEAPRDLELRFTRHGPVLSQDAANRRAFAMRSIWFEPGTSAYFGSSDYMTAKDWKGFLEAMERWGAPSENQVYADTAGNIGWIPAGKTPIRDNWDGLMPVPGDGRYEWKGFMRLEDLPQSYNPPQGWVATANQMNLPPGYPIGEKKVGFEWTNPSRFQRLAEVLSAKDKFTLADAMALQNDDSSMVDRRLAALLRPLQAADPEVANALKLVRNWDGRVSEDSGAAAVVEVWLSKHLGKAVVAKAVPANAQAVVANGDIAAILNLLENPDASLGSDPTKARDAILLESFAAAVGEVGQLLGGDSAGWAWGKLHHAQFEHALAPLADPATKAQMTVGRLAMGGSAYNPRAATYRPSDFRVTAGASFRMVLDVGNWDQSVTINTPGQSGNPYSPHYRDLAPLWASGAYVPLLYSRGAVEGAASEVIALRPRS